MHNFILILFLTCSMAAQAQTTISAGAVSGTWQKSGSPYKINGNIYVPSGQTLNITEGVKIEFQDTFKLDVYGKLSIKGKPNDTVVFTAKNTTKGWKGIKVFGQNKKDTVTVHYAKFEYFKTQEQYYLKSRSVLQIDSITGLVDIYNCRFTRNMGISNSGLNVNKSELKLQNCIFDYNEALDLRTKNAGPCSGSCAVLRNSNIKLDSILVNNNICHSPNYANDTNDLTAGSTGNFIVWDCNGLLNNSLFKLNVSSSYGSAIQFASTNLRRYKLTLTNVVFEQNASYQGGACLMIYNTSNISDKISFVNCVFKNNFILDWLKKPKNFNRRADFVTFNNKTELSLDGVKFLSSIGDVSCGFLNSIVKAKQSIWSNNQGLAVSLSQGSIVDFSNCIISNNAAGISVNQCTPMLFNSLIVNNRPNSTVKDIIGGAGIFSFFNGGSELFNCIVWGNKDFAGGMYNFLVDDGKKPLATNCIIEGSSDSIKFTDRATPGVPSTWVNVNPNSPEFVNPTAGAGIAYDALKADWHLKNTCNIISPGFDAGMIGSGNYPFGFPTVDLDGNPRTVGGIMDIGPYEIQAPNKYTKITSEPKDTTLCAGTQVAQMFKTSALGNNLSYQWQYSQDSSNWSNLPSQNLLYLSNYSTTRSGANYFRLIATNTACNKLDTTRKTVLFINPNPKPFLGNDTSIANAASITLNPGSYASYQWTLPKGGNTTASTFTGNKSNLDTGTNTITLRVVDSKGCAGSDTIKIKLQPAAGLQNPATIGIKIYPVPTSDLLNIEIPQSATTGHFQLSSMDGRILQSGSLQSNFQINVSNLSTGTYFLSMEIDGAWYGVKVVK